ncbi:hypothetical protein [Alkanindiges illinoisensis]|uniref:hypothetical protein n=1 Tax=Alkanindiges illinoisensis TaxID=197183 RepID=UPI00047E2B1D|nr:hypothetical protein [Alkanindiges illinoisensis]
MATDTDVQFFSHLNGLTLSNNWGDMCNLLDACLVDGVQLTSVTAASIDAQGDIHLSLYAAHNCLLFQVIELSGFADAIVDGTTRTINGKYRIKGTPSTTQLILKGNVVRSVTDPATINLSTLGAAKLASLGYDKVFTAQYKRVYRAKNPSAQHPFIRIDETLSGEGGGNYSSTYAKAAMVGLIENMTHIDDYADTSKLQLPLDTTDFTKNWKITGTGTDVTRGWCKWYYASNYYNAKETDTPGAGNRGFTLVGNQDAFYLLNATNQSNQNIKKLNSCGLHRSALQSDVVPNWFLMATVNYNPAGASTVNYNAMAFSPLGYNAIAAKFITLKYDPAARLSNHTYANPIVPDYKTGYSGAFGASNIPALEVPFYDDNGWLMGTLPHVQYAGKSLNAYSTTTPILADQSMYVLDSLYVNANTDTGGVYFYLGELE